MISNISGLKFDIATSNTGYFLLNEIGIQTLANAMNASVHIGVGSGKITTYNSYTAPIAGTPFIDVGNYYVTIMQKASNSYNYPCVYTKNYQVVYSGGSFYNGAYNLVVGYSADNIRFMGANTSNTKVYVFCEYTNINGVTKPCMVVKESTSNYFQVFHQSVTYESITIPTCIGVNDVNYVCIQEVAYNNRLAYFNGLYTSVRQYNCGYKTVALNGDTYDVLVSGGTSYPTIYCKRS